MFEDDSVLKNEDDLVCALRTTNMAQITVVKSILDAAGIPYFIEGDKVLRMTPPLSGIPYCGNTIWNVAIHVRRQDYEEVRQLLQEDPIEDIDERQDD